MSLPGLACTADGVSHLRHDGAPVSMCGVSLHAAKTVARDAKAADLRDACVDCAGVLDQDLRDTRARSEAARAYSAAPPAERRRMMLRARVDVAILGGLRSAETLLDSWTAP